MRCTLTEHLLPLAEPFVTAIGTVTRRVVWVVAIADDAGHIGLGEAAPLPVFGGEDPLTCGETLRTALPQLTADSILAWLDRGRPDAAIGRLEPLLAKAPCARSAIEGALIDLLSQRLGQPVAETLAGGPSLDSVPVNVVLGGPKEAVVLQAERHLARGFTCFKLKAGGDAGADLFRLRALREVLGPGPSIRVDANGAWTLERARDFLDAGREHNLEYCEQPLPVADLEGSAALRKGTGILIAIDEGVRHPSDVARIAAAQAADLIVLKPMFLGGWRATRQATDLARSQGLEVVISTAIDGSVGRAHATHMAAALGLGRRAQGLATGGLLAGDLTDAPLQPISGSIGILDRPGLGIGRLLAAATA